MPDHSWMSRKNATRRLETHKSLADRFYGSGKSKSFHNEKSIFAKDRIMFKTVRHETKMMLAKKEPRNQIRFLILFSAAGLLGMLIFKPL